jgi:2-polyprenyl-3-methyl-5-hydroxy-6-metoxy-1,4-benzoquinol methylase
MLKELFEQDRWLRIAGSKLTKSPYYNDHVYKKTALFLEEYVKFYGLSVDQVLKMYNDFTREYSRHIREFLKSGKYPYQNSLTVDLQRIDYDIVLILSVLISVHRHTIFCNLFNAIQKLKGNSLVIGVGSGLELDYFNGKTENVTAYDLTISKHVFQKYFTGAKNAYRNIFAIELLEHLSDPLEFIRMVYDSLEIGGLFHFTTATNIPQIDHLYNFDDELGFEKELHTIGFQIVEKEIIFHESIDSKLIASNTWYILKK